METETKNSLIVFLLLVALAASLFFVSFQLMNAVEKRDAALVKPTAKTTAKPAEAKTDSVNTTKLQKPATLKPK